MILNNHLQESSTINKNHNVSGGIFSKNVCILFVVKINSGRQNVVHCIFQTKIILGHVFLDSVDISIFPTYL